MVEAIAKLQDIGLARVAAGAFLRLDCATRKVVGRVAIIVLIMAARVTLKAVNDELARRGHRARLERASGYFYFWSEDSADWIDRTVRVETLNSLTLDQWVREYLWLKKVNAEMMRPGRVRPWIKR
jgi:hypothetical protein